MPFKTQHGSHYHMTLGCHGADIPCDTAGLTPCSDCCGTGDGSGTGGAGGSATAGMSAGSPVRQAMRDGGSNPSVAPVPDRQQNRPRRRGIPNAVGVTYTGYFLDARQMGELMAHLEGQGLVAGGLGRTISCPHVTLSYMPEDAHEGSFGQTQRMRVIGYGNDGRNEGIKVELIGQSPDAAIASLEQGVECPHVTLSVSPDGRPADTRDLDFEPLDEPFEMTGTYGGYRPSDRAAVTEPMRRPPRQDPPQQAPKVPSGATGLTPDEMFAVMDNPAIPRDGLVTDVAPVICEIREARGMLAVMRGAAGCGKSTVIEGLGLESSVVSPDEIRLRVSGLETDENGKLGISQRDNQLVWQMARQDVVRRCADGDGTVMVDAMHTRPRDIRQWKQVADRHGYKLVVVDLTDVPRDVSHRRNAGRIEWKQVPDSVIDRFYDIAEQNTQAVRREFTTVDRRGFRDIVEGLRGDAG